MKDPIAIITQLAERWPKCFSVYEGRRRPIKVGIRADILDTVEQWPGLSAALGSYVHNQAYLQTLVAGAERIDLAGEPAGVVTAAEAAVAAEELAARAMRRKAVPTTPAPAAPAGRISLADLKASARARKGATA